VTERAFGGRFGVTIAARYDDILDAAVDVLARRGFHQASIRQIARAADLSLAGLYHYVRGKDELLFLALARALDDLTAALDTALADARTPEGKLLALIRAHLEFAVTRGAEMKIVNRDYELLAEPRRSEIVARRGEYLARGIAILAELDPHGRTRDELTSATILLLGMLNGIATRPFLRSSADLAALAGQVGALFLYGFLERTTTGAALESPHDA
jgi:AcrR family transcriptional regulator